MKRLYNWSIKMGLCPEIVNPCNRIEFPKFDNTVTNPFSKKDLKILMDTLAVFGNERASLVILFALYTGKRLGEILSLTWSDVSIERGLVTLRGTNTKNKRTQTIPVNQKTLVVLKRCRQLKAGEYVFPCSTGKFFHNFGVVWQRIRRKAKLEGYRFHDLRHTYASYLISSGEVDIYTMQKLLGHQTITMTQRYAHLAPDTLRKATNVADEVFQDL